jgi:hypothetical protein
VPDLAKSVPRLHGAVTAQRAIPTSFGFRVERPPASAQRSEARLKARTGFHFETDWDHEFSLVGRDSVESWNPCRQ